MDAIEERNGIIQDLIAALEDIASTAQAASQSEPERFCEWAYHRAMQAVDSLKTTRDTETK